MIHKTYNTRYKLKQDLPGYDKGRELGVKIVEGILVWKFFEWDNLFSKWGYDFERGNISFSVDEISDERFFEPIGVIRDVIPKFPSKKELLDEYYHLIGEPKLVSSVDFIRTSEDIFYSDEFEDKVYEIFKEMYNKKHNL